MGSLLEVRSRFVLQKPTWVIGGHLVLATSVLQNTVLGAEVDAGAEMDIALFAA